MSRADDHSKKIQELLSQAERMLDAAAFLADEIHTEITFRGLRYTPSQVIPGKWLGSHETLPSDKTNHYEDGWQSSQDC